MMEKAWRRNVVAALAAALGLAAAAASGATATGAVAPASGFYGEPGANVGAHVVGTTVSFSFHCNGNNDSYMVVNTRPIAVVNGKFVYSGPTTWYGISSTIKGTGTISGSFPSSHKVVLTYSVHSATTVKGKQVPAIDYVNRKASVTYRATQPAGG